MNYLSSLEEESLNPFRRISSNRSDSEREEKCIICHVESFSGKRRDCNQCIFLHQLNQQDEGHSLDVSNREEEFSDSIPANESGESRSSVSLNELLNFKTTEETPFNKNGHI